ncbi:MAG: metallopeptidase TldD-related protein [bacterium]
MSEVIEKTKVEDNEISVEIKGSKIKGVREKAITNMGIRVFNQGLIGQAGGVGEIKQHDLIEKARKNLSIPYSYVLPREDHYKYIAEKNLLPEQIVALTEKLLNSLIGKYPDYIYSGKISFKKSTKSMNTNLNLDLIYSDYSYDVNIMFKQKDSINIIDGVALFFHGKLYDHDEIISQTDILMKKFSDTVHIKSGFYPVILLSSHPFKAKIASFLSADLYHQGASLFSGKLGQQLLHEQFCLFDETFDPDHNMVRPFDGEGVRRSDSKLALVEQGVLKNLLFDLKNAHLYNSSSTANGSRSPFSGVSIRPNYLVMGSSGKTLKQLLSGYSQAIFITASIGGEITSRGDYSFPTIQSYLWEDGNIVGRIENLSVSTNVISALGENWIGCSSDRFFPELPEGYFVFKAEVKT